MIQKNLGQCKMYVDSEEGKISLISNTETVLSIVGMKFLITEEKFSRIDIDGYEAKMFTTLELLSDDNGLDQFMINISNLVQYHLKENKNVLDSKAFLGMILYNTKKFIEDNY